MAWLKQPVYEITGKRGSLEEAVQRVQYGQPYDLEGNPDEELMLLEDYLKKGTSNIYVLVRGLSARSAPPPPLPHCPASLPKEPQRARRRVVSGVLRLTRALHTRVSKVVELPLCSCWGARLGV
jgi:hypothetical protein